MSVSLQIGALWALGLLGSFVWLGLKPPRSQLATGPAIAVIMLVAAIARLIPNFILPMGAGYDIESYRIIGSLVLNGQDVYQHPDAIQRYPYLPLQMYWSAAALWLANTFNAPLINIVRLAPIAADIALALVIFGGLRRAGHEQRIAFQGGILYALNPVSILVVAYHGQFDSIPALFLALAALAPPTAALSSGIWLGLGILIKSWPVLGLPSLLFRLRGWRASAQFLAIAALIPLAGVAIYTLVFHSAWFDVIGRATGYNRGVGVWGYTYFFKLAGFLQPQLQSGFVWIVENSRYLTLAALAAVWLFRARFEPAVAGILTVLVTFFACTHAFAIQYLLWPVPFAILSRETKWLIVYTSSAFVYMLLAYTTLIMELHITAVMSWPEADLFIIIPAGLPAWFVTIGWMISRLRRTSAVRKQSVQASASL